MSFVVDVLCPPVRTPVGTLGRQFERRFQLPRSLAQLVQPATTRWATLQLVAGVKQSGPTSEDGRLVSTLQPNRSQAPITSSTVWPPNSPCSVYEPTLVRPRRAEAVTSVLRPRVFVASSSEDIQIARAVESNLSGECDVTSWERQVFTPSRVAIESLEKVIGAVDAAVIVLGDTDVSNIRGEEHRVPRDNVMLELGMFIGRIGRSQTFIIVPEESEPRIPSDLAGINRLRFRSRRGDGNLQAALGSATNAILESLRKDSVARRPSARTVYFAAPHRNHERNDPAKSALRSIGTDVLMPYELIEERISDPSRITAKLVRSVCIEAIDSADYLVVDVSNYGSDTAWEIGYADAVGKPVVGLADHGIGISQPRTFRRKQYRQNFMHGWTENPVHMDLKSVRRELRGKRVHVCGSFSNEAAMAQLRESNLERDLHALVLPRDIIGVKDDFMRREKGFGVEARRHAINLLTGSDVALVMLPRHGTDTSWQIGHAFGKGIPVHGWVGDDPNGRIATDLIWADWMIAWELRQIFNDVESLSAFFAGLPIVSPRS